VREERKKEREREREKRELIKIFNAPVAIIHSQDTCDISTLETYYLNFIASHLYTQKWL